MTTGQGLVFGLGRIWECAYVLPMELSTTLLPEFTPMASTKFINQQTHTTKTGRKDPQPFLTLEISVLCICFPHVSSFLRLMKDVESCFHQDLCASLLTLHCCSSPSLRYIYQFFAVVPFGIRTVPISALSGSDLWFYRKENNSAPYILVVKLMF